MDAREGEVTSSVGSIVAYHRWIESDESPDFRQSEILKEIRDYNEVDCVSTWKLAQWLRGVQQEHGVEYIAPEVAKATAGDALRKSYFDEAVVLADQLIDVIKNGESTDKEQKRVQLLHAWLLEFHWREARPVFWRKHAMGEMTSNELIEDQNCLGALVRIDAEPEKIKRSFGYQYQFEPTQLTKLHEGSRCLFASNVSQGTQILDLDQKTGTLKLKLGPMASAPDSLNLIPDEYVSAKTIAGSVYRYVSAWANGKVISPAIDDLIHRRPPCIAKHNGGDLIDSETAVSDATVELIRRMDQTTLCVQGPPGTGKTFTAAKAIVQLLEDGKRIAVTANGHKAILNVLREVQQQLAERDISHYVYKAGGSKAEAEELDCEWIQRSGDVGSILALDEIPCVVGGTAWVFSREELQGKFDYLLVDEAGQFSLANVVGTGCCADNIVLMGDQMQLASPVQGAHPGESGMSALEYYLDGAATVPPSYGVLLNQTWRMHPEICGFVSDSIYESKLGSHPNTVKQQIHSKEAESSLVAKPAGIQFLPTSHEGNSQGSVEEVELVGNLFDQLMESGYTDFDGNYYERLEIEDILVVAPFNLQVRMLRERLGEEARVGTVDKFQGQQAPVVIVSMCSSTIDDSPRGADFLLNPNRLNVAISRAKALAVVVGSPKLVATNCGSIKEMELVNLYARLATVQNQDS